MLLLVTGKKNIHCLGDKEILWSKPSATERRATSVAVLPGSPGKLAIAMEQPSGYVGGVASNEFDIVYFQITDEKSPEALLGTRDLVLPGFVFCVLCFGNMLSHLP